MISSDQTLQKLKDNHSNFNQDTDNKAIVEEFIQFVDEGKTRIRSETKGEGEAEDSPSKLKTSSLIPGAKPQQSVFFTNDNQQDRRDSATVPAAIVVSPRDEAISKNSVEGRFDQNGAGQYASQVFPVHVPVLDV